jgi:hypothetical protein
MKNSDILRTVKSLRAHVRAKRRLNPDASEEQLVRNYLAALDFTVTEHQVILDEYRRTGARGTGQAVTVVAQRLCSHQTLS